MRVPFFLAKIKSLANQAEIICLIYSEGHIEMWTLNKSLPLVVFCDISNVWRKIKAERRLSQHHVTI